MTPNIKLMADSQLLLLDKRLKDLQNPKYMLTPLARCYRALYSRERTTAWREDFTPEVWEYVKEGVFKTFQDNNLNLSPFKFRIATRMGRQMLKDI